MAFFGVTVETIDQVLPHPNADKLSLGKLKGIAFEFVIGKDQFKIGDKVLYFPIDSLLPPSIIEALNLTGRLAGKDKNRLKTIKLRGALSQGLVCSVDKLLPTDMQDKTSEEITKFLGVTKYDPPPVLEKNANLLPLPSGQAPYDIEGADRNQHIVDLMMDRQVGVMEKMEGQNFSVTRQEDKTFVNQRNFTIQVKEGAVHSFWALAEKFGLLDKVKQIPGREVIIYGEMCGPSIQGNIYKLKQHTIFVFDIRVDNKWMPLEEMMKTMGFTTPNELGHYVNEQGLAMAPLLFKGTLKEYLKDQSVQSVSNGNSLYGDTLREGIVIKPLQEDTIVSYGRLIIKQRSPVYLAGSDN